MRKRVYLSAAGIIILAIIALVIAVFLLSAPIISSYLSHKLGVNISMGSVRVSSSGMKVTKFKINNPRG